MDRQTLVLLTIGLTTLGAPRVLHAQDPPRAVVEFAGGALFFPDDGTVTEGFGGGALRIYMSPRISVGPEVAAIRGSHHSHLMLTLNTTVELAAPGGGVRPLTPFVVVGAGLFRTRERFPDNTVFTHGEGAFTAGAGVRTSMSRRVFGGGEVRVGWELHIRANAFVGVRLGGH